MLLSHVHCRSAGVRTSSARSRIPMFLRPRLTFRLALLGLLAALTPAITRAQTYTENPPLPTLAPTQINNPLLAQLLGFGEIEVLDDLPSYEEAGDQPLSLRLISMPGDNDACVPETDVSVCNSRYYLVVISDSVAPGAAVFEVGQVGEVTDVLWLAPPDAQHVRIHLEVRRYPESVLEENPALKAKQEAKRYTLVAGLTSLHVQEEQR